MNYLETRYDRPLVPGTRAPLSPRQVWRIAWARRKWIVWAICLSAFLGLGIALFAPKTYQATVSLFVEFPGEDPVTGQRLPAGLAESYMATQVDLLKSERVRLAAIDALGMTQDPRARRQFEEAASPGASYEVWLANRLFRNIEVAAGSDSRIIRLGYTSEDPRRAAEVANALAREYMATNLELNLEPARQRREDYNRYLDSLLGEVEAAQEKLTEAQQELGVLDLDQTGQVDTSRLEDLNLRLNEAKTQRQAAEAEVQRVRQLRRENQPLAAQAEILSSPYVQELKGRLVQLESRRAELRETLGSNHPRMQSLGAELATVRNRLKEEIESYIEASRGQASTAASRETALRETLEQERREVLQQQRLRDEIARYVRQLESAKSVYQATVEQYDQVLGGSELLQSDVSVVSWATPPQIPEGLPGRVLLALTMIVGLIVGGSLAMLTELMSRRVRGSEDVERELGLPVLGET